MQELWESICCESNIRQAWMRVKANMGAPGVDKVTVEDFEAHLSENLSLLQNILKQNQYQIPELKMLLN